MLYNIEIKEAGVWNEIDTADSLEDALMLASSYVDGLNKENMNIREEWVRIVTPDCKTL